MTNQLTKLEQFVASNSNVSDHVLASQLNRTERAISMVRARIHRKYLANPGQVAPHMNSKLGEPAETMAPSVKGKIGEPITGEGNAPRNIAPRGEIVAFARTFVPARRPEIKCEVAYWFGNQINWSTVSESDFSILQSAEDERMEARARAEAESEQRKAQLPLLIEETLNAFRKLGMREIQ